MKDQGTSITTEDNIISNTGTLFKVSVNPKVNKSLTLLAVMLSMYALTGSPATTVNTAMSEFNKLENMVSVTDFKNIETKLKEPNYSFISAIGFNDDNVSFPEMFI